MSQVEHSQKNTAYMLNRGLYCISSVYKVIKFIKSVQSKLKKDNLRKVFQDTEN